MPQNTPRGAEPRDVRRQTDRPEVNSTPAMVCTGAALGRRAVDADRQRLFITPPPGRAAELGRSNWKGRAGRSGVRSRNWAVEQVRGDDREPDAGALVTGGVPQSAAAADLVR